MKFAQVVTEAHRGFVARRLKAFLILALVAIPLLAVFAIHPMYGLVDPPAVSTDRTGYLAGSTVQISGSGFQAGEVVSVQVTHASGDPASGVGHGPAYVSAASDGTFTASWQLSQYPWDTGSNDLLVQAAGASSGAKVSTPISRIATVRADKYDYQPGQTAVITGEGFRPAESVTIRVQHSNGLAGAGDAPFNAVADADGKISATWLVDAGSVGSIFRLTATQRASGLTATSTFTDPPVSIIDDGGPDDINSNQLDLNFLQVDSQNLPTSLAVTWSWDDTAWTGGNSGDACALFDTDGDGKVNASMCVTVGGSPATFTSTRLYTCGDDKSDRCTQNLTEITTFSSTGNASVVPGSDPFGANPAHTAGNCVGTNCVTADTVANLTVMLSDIGGSNAKLINVCSYPSIPPNSNPSECIITPNNGFLTIVKTVADAPTLLPQAFTFNASAASQTNVSSWTSPSFTAIGTKTVVQSVSYGPTTTLDLNEVLPTHWKLEPSVPRCKIQTATPEATGTDTALGVDNLEIRSGLETICTFTDSENTDETQGYLKISKVFNPLTSGFAGTFAITYNCGAGDVTVNLAAGGSTTVGPFNVIPTAPTCTVTEPNLPTAPAGWTFGTPSIPGSPATIVAGAPANAVGVTVTNTISRDQGYLKISKVFDALTSGFAGTFAIKYNCGAGDVTVNVAGGGSTTVGPFDSGTSCTVTEPTLPTPPAGWTFGTPSISGSPAAITKGDQAAAVGVTVTNTISRDQGYLKISKVFDALTSGFAGTFAIKYNCGAGDVTVNLAGGGTTTVGPFDSGTSCAVTEPVLPTPPANWTFGTPSISGSPAAITKGDQAAAVAVTVTNTISRDQGYLKISKVFDALTSGFAGTFAIKYNCGAGDVTVNLAGGGTTTVGPFDAGTTSCAVTEPVLPTPPANWTFGTPSISGSPAAITKGDQAAAVAVTVTNTISRDQGYLKISKVFDALTSGFAGTFAIKYNCGAGDVTVNLAGGGTTTVGPFDAGTTSCAVTEPVLPTAPANWTFGTPSISGSPAAITKGDQAAAVAVTVTNTISRDQGYLKISKVFDALTSGFAGTFAIKYNCGAGDVTVNLAGGGTTTVGPFDAGTTSCAVTEPVLPTPPANWTFGTPSISGSPAAITKGDQAAAVGVTVTNTISRDQGYLKISKVFDALTSGFAGTFAIKYNCGAGDVTVNLAGGGTTTVGPFDAGTTSCAVTEPVLPTAPANWTFGTPSISGSPAAITKGDQAAAVAVTVTNTISRDQGYLKINKVFDALTSGFAGTFAIKYNCGAGDVTVNLAGGGTTTVGPFSAGTTSCAVSEPVLPTAPANWTFGTPSISGSPAAITKGDQAAAVTVTVTNTISRDQGYLKINKVFDALTSGFAGTFAIKYNCGAGDVTVNLAGGGTTTVGPFNAGTTSCAVSEPVLPTAPTGWTFGTPSISGSPAAITKGDQAAAVAVTVTNTISRDQGYLKINKVFNPLTSGFAGTFAIKYNCGAGDVTVNVAAGASSSAGPFDTGTSCTVTEPVLPTPPTGWTFGTPSISGSPATIIKSNAASGVPVTVTNTITRDTGSLTITKAVVGGGAGFTGSFGVRAVCGGVTYNATIIYPSPGFVTITGIPTGNTCVVTETSQSAAPTGYSFAAGVVTGSPTLAIDGTTARTALVTNTVTSRVKVIKTVSIGDGPPQPLSSLDSYTFQLRTGASTTAAGTIRETLTATSANGGVLNFTYPLVAGQHYQLCEVVAVGWNTNLPSPFVVFDASGDNSVLCSDFTVVDPGTTRTFNVINTRPPGGLSRTIGYWKNWSSCTGGKQQPILDGKLPVTVGNLTLTTCQPAVNILDKRNVTGTKLASDPAYNMAAQLLAASLNYKAGALWCSAIDQAVVSGQALLKSINFLGTVPYAASMTSLQQTTANTLATLLDKYNNNNLAFCGAPQTVPVSPTITSADNATFTTGVGGTFTLTATGSSPLTKGVIGALPAGVTFTASTGVLTVPTTLGAGSYTITFKASNFATVTQTFTLTINP